MDTFVGYNLKKGIMLGIMGCLLLLVTACPEEEDCFDMASSNYIPNLILLSPEQETYNQGDVLTLTLNIPSVNNYFGTEVDIFDWTDDDLAKLRLGFDQLFTDNVVNIITGSQANSAN
ncbi:MAG: hypothetical protein AAF901_02520, partial [Bacteroidota bacterium]